MGNFTKSMSWGAAGVGTLMIAAAQTKPEEAISNLAGWLKFIGIDSVPSIVANADADKWATIFGILLVLVAVAIYLQRKSSISVSCSSEPEEGREYPEKRKTGTQIFLEEIEAARRMAGHEASGSETPFARIYAEAKAVAKELEGRISYVRRVLDENDAADLKNWRSKIDLQRVPFDDLGASDTSGLPYAERECLRIAVRALAELDRAVDLIVAEPRKFKTTHAAGIYRQRATKARVMLQNLFNVMDADDG